MSKHALASQERRVKRLAARYGVHVMKAQKMFGKIAEHGGYMLRNDETGAILFGNQGYEFSATLDEIEEWLDANTARDER